MATQNKVVDADGHVVGPMSAWPEYVEAKYRDLAPRMVRDEDGWVSTTDPTLPKAQGQEGLRKMITEAAGTMKPRPFIHNHVIELLGPDRAKGTSYVEVRMTREGKKWLMTGWYDDEYVKVGGEWKFQSRKTTIDSFGPLSEGV